MQKFRRSTRFWLVSGPAQPVARLGTLSGARVVALVHGAEVIPIDVGVELRRREIGVSQHFLHGTEVGATLEQVRGERVSQRMRCDTLGQTGPPRRGFDDTPGANARQWRTTRIQEQNASGFTAIERGPDLSRVQRHRAQRSASDRNEPFLGALAEDARYAVLEQDVLQLERHQLGDARARGVGELEQRAIADGQRLVGVRRSQQLVYLGYRQHRRERAPPLGGFDAFAGIARGEPLPYQKLEVGADRGDLTADRRGREAEILEEVDEFPELRRGELLWGLRSSTGCVLRQARDVAQIALDGVSAVPGLEREVIAKALQVERPSYWGGRARRRRRMIHRTITRTGRPAATPSTVLTRRIALITTSRSVPKRLTR